MSQVQLGFFQKSVKHFKITVALVIEDAKEAEIKRSKLHNMKGS